MEENKIEIPAPPVKEPDKTYPTWIDLLAIVGGILAASGIVGVALGVLIATESVSKEFGLWLGYTLQFVLSIAFVWWYRAARRGEAVKIGFALGKASPIILLWGLILMFAVSLLVEPVIAIFPEKFIDMLQNAIGTGGWAMLTTIVMAPVLEELLFRGMIQGSLTRKYGAVAGVLMASLVFGVIHLIPQQVVNAFFVGIVLGFVYLRTGTLMSVILLHAINNAISYLLMNIGDGVHVSMRELVTNPTIYWSLYGVAALLVVVAAWQVAASTRNKKTAIDPADGNK